MFLNGNTVVFWFKFHISNVFLSFVHEMALRCTDDEPLPEPMMTYTPDTFMNMTAGHQQSWYCPILYGIFQLFLQSQPVASFISNQSKMWWSKFASNGYFGTKHSHGGRAWQGRQWWRHQMETFSAILALCEGNPTVTGALMFSLICTWTIYKLYIDGLVQDCGISIANALEILQSCKKVIAFCTFCHSSVMRWHR